MQISLSRVGFSTSHNHAFLAASVIEPNTSESGYFTFERINGSWASPNWHMFEAVDDLCHI
jgi:hypothetical protein